MACCKAFSSQGQISGLALRDKIATIWKTEGAQRLIAWWAREYSELNVSSEAQLRSRAVHYVINFLHRKGQVMSYRDTSRALEIIISRAFIDKSFRDRLINDKKSVIEEYTLSPEDIEAIMQVDSEVLEKARQTAAMVGVVHLRGE